MEFKNVLVTEAVTRIFFIRNRSTRENSCQSGRYSIPPKKKCDRRRNNDMLVTYGGFKERRRKEREVGHKKREVGHKEEEVGRKEREGGRIYCCPQESPSGRNTAHRNSGRYGEVRTACLF
jgi:hypothetical protein